MWITLKDLDGTIEQLFDYWILGQFNKEPARVEKCTRLRKRGRCFRRYKTGSSGTISSGPIQHHSTA